MFEDFFRLHAKGADGRTVIMHEVGVEYELRNGPSTVKPVKTPNGSLVPEPVKNLVASKTDLASVIKLTSSFCKPSQSWPSSIENGTIARAC